MSAYRSTVKGRLSYIVLLAGVILAISLFSFFYGLDEHIAEISQFKGKEQANNIIAAAVKKQLDAAGETEFFCVQRDEKGKIISAEVNSAAVNELQNNLISEINSEITALEEKNVKIPIGTLTGITYLSGRGFNVDLRLHQLGAADCEMKSVFESVGINQTKFSLYVHIEVTVEAILPVKTSEVTVSSDYLAVEAIIVGEVPKMYLSE